MRKIPTLFKRNPNNMGLVTPEVNMTVEIQRLLWQIDDVQVSEKIDGSCCAFIGNAFYGRRELRKGKQTPPGFLPAQQSDPATGKTPGWVPVYQTEKNWKWFMEAAINSFGRESLGLNKAGVVTCSLEEVCCQTFEAIGPHFQGNPHKLDKDVLEQHGKRVIKDFPLTLKFEEIRDWLASHDVEGVVLKLDDKTMTKIKRRDFGLEWPIKEKSKE